MKKLVYLLAAGVMVLASSCDDLLDSTNYTEKTTATFPETYNDVQQLATGVYQNLSVVNANPHCSFLYAAQNASDDMFGGGGSTDQPMVSYDLLGNAKTDQTRQFWADRFTGVARANAVIAGIDKPKDYPSKEARNQILGEMLILRGFYYYELASMYGNVPLYTTTETADIPQASAAEVWGQILLDFKTAADIMPAKQTAVNGKLIDGKVDKYVAEGLLARAWLFYTGMYCNGDKIADMVSTNYQPLESVKLPNDSVLTREKVFAYIKDCKENSGYSLVDKFQNLWAYTNRLTQGDYPYAAGKGYKFAEDDNAVNPESMFMIKYNSYASWGTTIGYANGFSLHFGIRGGQDAANTFPFGQGWGAGPVNPGLYSDWKNAEPADPRREATIQILSELPNYTPSSDWTQGTDFFNKKWAPVYAKGEDGYWNYCEYMYDSSSWPEATYHNFQLDDLKDLVLLRYADVLLMYSEIGKNKDGINEVRARAGLPAISEYSLQALQNERRWELACEGTRWNDIRRWHIAAAALEKQEGQPVIYNGVKSTNKASKQIGGYTARYNATAGFFKIPEYEIENSQNLKQNPGYENNEGHYADWKEN